ncbi:hypothetical protein CSUI_005199, partial [Cystoisospora suis]
REGENRGWLNRKHWASSQLPPRGSTRSHYERKRVFGYRADHRVAEETEALASGRRGSRNVNTHIRVVLFSDIVGPAELQPCVRRPGRRYSEQWCKGRHPHCVRWRPTGDDFKTESMPSPVARAPWREWSVMCAVPVSRRAHGRSSPLTLGPQPYAPRDTYEGIDC